MTVITIKRVDALFDLVRSFLPRRVQSSGDFDDWNIVSAALLSVAADLVEGHPERTAATRKGFARKSWLVELPAARAVAGW